MQAATLSIVIVTYNREHVLVDTITSLLAQAAQCDGFGELIVVDQTARHDIATQGALSRWHERHAIQWIRLSEPDLTGAMNRGLIEAESELVLFLDDDIVPCEQLLGNHQAAHGQYPEAMAVVGQVLQPGQCAEPLEYTPRGSGLGRYMDFPFRSTISCFIENAMAGNLSVKREAALRIGGFDENFTPPVASRFESEFAKRVLQQGGKIWFEATASIHHLAAKSGGTRSMGSHLTSASPRYGVGDYYFALRHARGFECFRYCVRRFFREVRTRFHLSHPWYIPVKLLGEARAFLQALGLRKKPCLLPENAWSRAGSEGSAESGLDRTSGVQRQC